MFGTMDQEAAVLSPPDVLTEKKAVCCGSREIVVGLNCMLVAVVTGEGEGVGVVGVVAPELPIR